MATPSWTISGRYYETCSCDFICPCILTQMSARPTKDSCTFAMALAIDTGSFGGLDLNGIPFIVLGFTPGPMGQGNWSVGLVVDERASDQQRDAITAIASGGAGGPMEPLGALIGKFLGVARALRSHVHALGLAWDDTSGRNNGHYAPFNWSNAA